MKEISVSVLLHALGTDTQSAKVFVFKSCNLKSITIYNERLESCSFSNSHAITLPNVTYVDLSYNDLHGNILDSNLFDTLIPSAWWINLSGNRLITFELECSHRIPLCLGRLDITGVDAKSLDKSISTLKKMHILRLIIDIKDTIDEFKDISIQFPFAWTINNQYIPLTKFTISTLLSQSRAEMSSIEDDSLSIMSDSVLQTSLDAKKFDALPAPNKTIQQGEWNFASPNQSECKILEALHRMSPNIELSDEMRLDILLEDYLEEAYVFNEHGIKHQRIKCEPMPFPQPQYLLFIPHNILLDLSALLTSSILFQIPKDLLINAAIILLGQYLESSQAKDIVTSPPFVRTCLVSIIRRICKRQAQIYQKNVSYEIPADSIVQPHAHHNPAMLDTHNDMLSFYFLRAFKKFLSSTNDLDMHLTPNDYPHRVSEFTELEKELLNNLPDIPIKSMIVTLGIHDNSSQKPKHDDWVGLVARHSVLLLTASPLCPPLTKPQTNKSHQEMYILLIPLLSAASMLYKDLDIGFTGPEVDGRINIDKDKMIAGSVLPFGVGFPNSYTSELSWNHSSVKSPLRESLKRSSTSNVDISSKSLIKTQTRPSSRESFVPRVIEGFSNDLSWDPAFLLSPIEDCSKIGNYGWARFEQPPLTHLMSDDPSSVPISNPVKTTSINDKRVRASKNIDITPTISSRPQLSYQDLRDKLFKEMGSLANSLRLQSSNTILGERLSDKRKRNSSNSFDSTAIKEFRWSKFKSPSQANNLSITEQTDDCDKQTIFTGGNTFLTHTMVESIDATKYVDCNQESTQPDLNILRSCGTERIGCDDSLYSDDNAHCDLKEHNNITSTVSNDPNSPVNSIHSTEQDKQVPIDQNRVAYIRLEQGDATLFGRLLEPKWFPMTKKFSYTVTPHSTSPQTKQPVSSSTVNTGLSHPASHSKSLELPKSVNADFPKQKFLRKNSASRYLKIPSINILAHKKIFADDNNGLSISASRSITLFKPPIS